MQTDLKKLVAYSSVSHLGFCMLGIFAMNEQAFGKRLMIYGGWMGSGTLFVTFTVAYFQPDVLNQFLGHSWLLLCSQLLLWPRPSLLWRITHDALQAPPVENVDRARFVWQRFSLRQTAALLAGGGSRPTNRIETR